MRKFVGYYDNGTYRVGCNGAAIYVYNQNNQELARFKDIKYAYRGKFLPDSNIFGGNQRKVRWLFMIRTT